MTPLPEAANPVRDYAALVGGIVVAALAILLGPNVAADVLPASPIAATAVFFAIIFLPMAIAAIGLGFLTPVPAYGLGERAGYWAGIAALSGVGGLLIAASYSRLSGSAIDGTGAAFAASGLLAGFVLILFQVGCEELFFRGWMQPLIARLATPLVAIAASAVLFAGFHVLGGARAPLTLLNLLLGGIWFGLLAWRSGGVLAPLLAHFGWNASEQLLLGLDPNPGIGDFGALFDWDMAGSPLWGGSDEGLNASIAMTFVLLALIVPLVWPRTRPDVSAPAAPALHPPGRVPA
jgi:uncharacterized protein